MTLTMCSMMCCAERLRTFPGNYIYLGIITCTMGILVGFVSAMYTWQSVVLAAGITVGIFLGLTVYAWNTETDFTGCGPFLVGALLALTFFGLTLSILSLFGVQIEWL